MQSWAFLFFNANQTKCVPIMVWFEAQYVMTELIQSSTVYYYCDWCVMTAHEVPDPTATWQEFAVNTLWRIFWEAAVYINPPLLPVLRIPPQKCLSSRRSPTFCIWSATYMILVAPYIRVDNCLQQHQSTHLSSACSASCRNNLLRRFWPFRYITQARLFFESKFLSVGAACDLEIHTHESKHLGYKKAPTDLMQKGQDCSILPKHEKLTRPIEECN